jgi:hypothetical protein
MFLERWNSTKSLFSIWQHFSCLLGVGIPKIWTKLNYHVGFLRPMQGLFVLPDGLNWLCYFAGSSKSYHENSISCIFLESPYQVDMKSIVKCWNIFRHSKNIPCTIEIKDYYRNISCILKCKLPLFQGSKAVYTVTKFLPAIWL